MHRKFGNSIQSRLADVKRCVPPGCALLLRLGDWWEAFGEDALTVAPITGAALTVRWGSPCCGIRADTLDTALAKIVRVGRSVALAERLADGSGRLEVYRIVQPYK